MIRTQEFQAKFKSLFEHEKNRLLFSGRASNEQFAVQSDDLMDEVDFTSFEIENQMRMRLATREALYLKKIEEALARIQAGTFGQCDECEEDIELRRLEARPTTTLCVACKEAAERNEKLHIDGHSHKSLGRTIKFA
ncbi:MAG: TraR/DksA family transcriptional regulator [Bdellovibrionales bacterium]|nr:TraR/DksA family transcriptional regulator [Bdellovibrionales bacterium]